MVLEYSYYALNVLVSRRERGERRGRKGEKVKGILKTWPLVVIPAEAGIHKCLSLATRIRFGFETNVKNISDKKYTK